MKIKTVTAILLSSFLAFSSTFSQQVLAQETNPKRREGLPGRRLSAGTRGAAEKSNESTRREGLPGRRLGGGTRGECDLNGKNLIAIVPETNLGVTQAAKPNLLFYLPATSQPKLVEFILQDENFNVIYEKKLTTTKNKGIVKIDLSDDPSLAGLKVGKNYRWFFSIICNRQRRENDIAVEGWVRREVLDYKTAQLLKVATPIEKVNIYAKQGFGQDALITLADLMDKQPRNSQLSATWLQLLRSMKLDAIAQEPFFKLEPTPN
jgi:hypothetical protein